MIKKLIWFKLRHRIKLMRHSEIKIFKKIIQAK